MKIYYIGGSPCSGKSTVAELLSKRYGLSYFKVDDFLEKYAKIGAQKGFEICQKQQFLSIEKLFMRDPKLQCQEELQFYREIFAFLIEDVSRLGESAPVITEGAAYLPELVRKIGISSKQYFAILPAPEFQISHYQKRTWIPHVLKDCADPKQAFQNWMERDVLFAQAVRTQCTEASYPYYLNDGQASIEAMAQTVANHFGL